MKIFLTILACGVVVATGVLGFIYSGLYDVSALHPDNPIIAWALHKTSDRSVEARLGSIQVPAGLDKEDVVLSGAKLFADHCVVCHGGPGLPSTDIAQGLNPQPARLFNPRRHADMAEMYWFIENGVKMTAMPGFGKTHPDTDIWALAAFLKKAPGMSPQEFSNLTGIQLPVVKPGSDDTTGTSETPPH
ncbi:MAG TPA: cytochrome c [Beijerinckiaceae bacterium]|nr:cytochrome c [Beijerinckiaceae bacterium]